LILTEEEYLKEQRKARSQKKIVDQIFGEKLLAGEVVVGYGKKNPNIR
jgi:hypothetical protein